MGQAIKYINIKDLVLWTENPRDPIDKDASDQDVVNRAFKDYLKKWTLPKLAKEMGEYYDFSELPTVVYHEEKPVVYDGNRRIILGKIKHGLVSVPFEIKSELPYFPEEIPCNVCSQKIALNNIYRKHIDTGSWLPLERDIFLHKFMGQDKSTFLILEEETGVISANPHLNQRFVKDEIFKENILESLGYSIEDSRLYSLHNEQEDHLIFSDISRKVKDKVITTRQQRGKVIEVLDPSTQQLIDQNKTNESRHCNLLFKKNEKGNDKIQQTRRTQKKEKEIFGGKLYLSFSGVSDIYRDITDLYQYYIKNKKSLSQSFPCIIRMSLRLLCEAAAKDCDLELHHFLRKYFEDAKKNLDQDTKTTLANQNVTNDSLTQLLHTGAHNYHSSSNLEQTIAMSIIIGAILEITHGKEQ